MSKTKKLKAGKLKKGSKFQIPAQAIIVKDILELGTPTLEGKVKVFTVSAAKGPLCGQVWHIAMHDDEDIQSLLKAPWPRRVYDWTADHVWRRPS